MAELTVIATIIAKPGCEGPVKQALLDLIAPTRAEPGCLRYDLQQDLEQPRVFVFVEAWSSQERHTQHMASEHLRAFPLKVDGLVEHWDVKRMVQVG